VCRGVSLPTASSWDLPLVSSHNIFFLSPSLYSVSFLPFGSMPSLHASIPVSSLSHHESSYSPETLEEELFIIFVVKK